MSGPKKLDVELRGGTVVAVWYGCLMLPFKEHVVDHDRMVEMDTAYDQLEEQIKDGSFQPMNLLKNRLEGQAYGYEEDGTAKKPAAKYTPPSSDRTLREG